MRTRLFFILLGLLLTTVACSEKIPDAEWEIVIDGDVESTQTFNYAQMAKSKLKPVEYLATRSDGSSYMTKWQGITFYSMMERAGVKRNQFNIDTYVLLTSADGRTIKTTLAQLRSAMIALKDGEGHWLADTQPEAPILLVAPGLPAEDWIPVVRFNVSKPKD